MTDETEDQKVNIAGIEKTVASLVSLVKETLSDDDRPASKADIGNILIALFQTFEAIHASNIEASYEPGTDERRTAARRYTQAMGKLLDAIGLGLRGAMEGETDG